MSTAPGSCGAGVGLEIATIGWNVREGIIAAAAGALASSVALIAFGIDSFVETTSGAVLWWRLRAELTGGDDPEHLERIERRAARAVGAILLGLAVYIVIDAGRRLLGFGAGENAYRPAPASVPYWFHARGGRAGLAAAIVGPTGVGPTGVARLRRGRGLRPLLTPPPQLDEELWARIRQRWRKGRVVAINRKTLRLALLRPMPERPLTKEVMVGWAYVATEHELRRECPADELAMEWLEDT